MKIIALFMALCYPVSSCFAAEFDEDFIVGNYKLHFSQAGDLIEPDEYYIFQAVKNEKDGFKKSARKYFQRAASYGNTFGIFYTGLLYLQEDEVVKGYAWLTLVDTKRFPFASRVKSLRSKLEAQLNSQELEQSKVFAEKLNHFYGATAGFNRRLHWSRNFKLTGSNIKGYVPHKLSIQTDFSHGVISPMNVNVSTARIEKSIKQFVYEYEMDYRITNGEVNMGELELVDEK